MAMQNLTAALHNEQLKELFSNCSYKCFLDQGGVDANALAEIQELSKTEFDALSTDEPGVGVMVWGKKVVLFDAKVKKDNPLYGLISTDFHGKENKKEETSLKKEYDSARKKKRGEIRRKRKTSGPSYDTEEVHEEKPMGERDSVSRIILQMASYQDVGMKDILCILEDLPEEMITEKIDSLTNEGRLTAIDSPYGIRYRKGR